MSNSITKAQDKQKLKDKRLEEECAIWSAIAEKYEKENNGFSHLDERR